MRFPLGRSQYVAGLSALFNCCLIVVVRHGWHFVVDTVVDDVDCQEL